MMQGIWTETYFGFMVCREISESVTGLPAEKTPFVFIRQKAGDVSFSGFRERNRRSQERLQLARVTAIDNRRKWEGGHLAEYNQWPAQRRERFDILQEFYGPNAIDFDVKYGDLLEHDVGLFLEQFKGRILVVGCGSGKEVQFLWKQGCDVWGIDFSPEAVLLARRRYPHLRKRFFVEDMHNIDVVLSGMFNGIVANAVFLHLLERSDMPIMLASIHKRLRKDGLVFIRLIDKNGRSEEIDSDQYPTPRWFVYFKQDELVKWAEEAGFRVEKIEQRDHIKYPIVHWLSVLLRKVS